MFLSKENLILDPSNKYIQVGNMVDKSEISFIDICAIKTTLLPTIKLPLSSMVSCPKAIKKDDKYFLSNSFVNVMEITETDYLYIPRIENLSSMRFPSILAWLYGKYLINGYSKNSNGILQLIIPVKRISEKEKKQVLNLDNTFVIKSTIEPFTNVIITNNTSIIDMFCNISNTKSLKNFILEASISLYNTFLHSILVECDENKLIKIDNTILANELFINTYSKTGKILKVIEIRKNNKKKSSKTKKTYFIKYAEPEDYEIIGNNLYAKVVQNRLGRNTSGIDINKNEICEKENIVCNSILIKNIKEGA